MFCATSFPRVGWPGHLCFLVVLRLSKGWARYGENMVMQTGCTISDFYLGGFYFLPLIKHVHMRNMCVDDFLFSAHNMRNHITTISCLEEPRSFTLTARAQAARAPYTTVNADRVDFGTEQQQVDADLARRPASSCML